MAGRKRNYNLVSDSKIAKMMEVKFQQRTEAKIKWAVKLYNEWHDMRLDKVDYEEQIFDADLNDVSKLTKENLEFALCRFICEVKKVKEDADYPGKTLYQLVCALQNYLKKHDLNWCLVHSDDFVNFQCVLDTVMQERAARAIGTVKRQAQVISSDYENKLWDRNVLGEDSPDKLRNTVLYLLGVNLALRAGDEHYALRHPGGCTPSQFSFEVNDQGVRCLVYREDCVTKTNRGGLKDMKKERKIVWVKPNVNWQQCPVRLIEKYFNLLPKGGAKPNLYLQSLKKVKPFCWYSVMPVGINKIRGVVSSILHDAGLDGYFTNHSLRRTCATRLFQAGQSSKIIKEITGHVSDAVNKYQSTSDDQRMHVSSIIQGDVVPVKLSQAEPMSVVLDSKKVSDEKFKLPKFKLPINVKKHESSLNDGVRPSSEVGEMIQNVVEAVGNRRAKITMEVELLD